MPAKITLKELTVFHYVVKYNTVKMAADHLHITQSAASQALLKLETIIDSPLFDRHGRQLILNENGRLLLPMAINILNSVQEVENLFSTHPTAIKIGASTTIGNYIMPNTLALFRQHYPSSTLDMMVGNTEAIITAVANFDIDIGLIEGNCHHEDIIVKPWQDDELVMFKAFSKEQKYFDHQQLSSAPWLLREKGSGTRAIVERFLHAQLNQFQISMELGNSEAIKYAVAAGLGISCLSHYVVSDLLAQQKISLIHCGLPKLTRQFYIITHRNKKQTQGMTRFIQLLESKEFIINCITA